MLGWRSFPLFLKANNLVCRSFNYIHTANMRSKYVADTKVFLERMFKQPRGWVLFRYCFDIVYDFQQNILR